MSHACRSRLTRAGRRNLRRKEGRLIGDRTASDVVLCRLAARRGGSAKAGATSPSSFPQRGRAACRNGPMGRRKRPAHEMLADHEHLLGLEIDAPAGNGMRVNKVSKTRLGEDGPPLWLMLRRRWDNAAGGLPVTFEAPSSDSHPTGVSPSARRTGALSWR
jgi:hypothetical protein